MILTLWANKYFRDGVYIALVCLFLWALYSKIHHDGKEEGKREGASVLTEEVEKLRSADREATNKILDGYKDRISELDSQYQTAIQSSLKAAAMVSSVRQERQAAQGTVQSTPDAGIDALIRQKLGHSDPNSQLSYREQREIASCLVDKPLCQQENEALRVQVQSFQPQISALNGKVDALNGKYQALDGYTARLEADYRTVYNAFPHKYRALKCLGLWRCGDRKLKAPTPAELKHPS